MKRIICFLLSVSILVSVALAESANPLFHSHRSIFLDIESYYGDSPTEDVYLFCRAGVEALMVPNVGNQIMKNDSYSTFHVDDAIKDFYEILNSEAASYKASGEYHWGIIKAVFENEYVDGNDYLEDTAWLSDLVERYKQNKETQTASAHAEYIDFDYAAFSRNPENYIGQNVKATGKVIQVMGSRSQGYTIRLATNGNSDIVYVNVYSSYVPDANILQNDELTIYGSFAGDYTYTTVLNSSVTLPRISARIVEFGADEGENEEYVFEPQVWYDANNVKITCTEYGYKQGSSSPYLKFSFIVENNSDKTIWAGINNDSANSWAIGTGGNFCDNGLLPGKKLKSTESVYLGKCDIDSIEDLEIYEFDMWVDLDKESYEDEKIVVHMEITDFMELTD